MELPLEYIDKMYSDSSKSPWVWYTPTPIYYTCRLGANQHFIIRANPDMIGKLRFSERFVCQPIEVRDNIGLNKREIEQGYSYWILYPEAYLRDPEKCRNMGKFRSHYIWRICAQGRDLCGSIMHKFKIRSIPPKQSNISLFSTDLICRLYDYLCGYQKIDRFESDEAMEQWSKYMRYNNGTHDIGALPCGCRPKYRVELVDRKDRQRAFQSPAIGGEYGSDKICITNRA